MNNNSSSSINNNNARCSDAPVAVEPLVSCGPCAALLALPYDAWTQERLQTLTAQGPGWPAAVAVGLSLRLGRAADPREALKDRLAGSPNPRVEVPAQWCRGLSPAELDALDERALAAIDGLEDRWEAVWEYDWSDDVSDVVKEEAHRGLAPELDPFLARGFILRAGLILELCEAREHLACVEEVFRRAGRPTRTAVVLPERDIRWTSRMASLVQPRLLEWSHVLGRAAVGEPDAWWVQALADVPG